MQKICRWADGTECLEEDLEDHTIWMSDDYELVEVDDDYDI